MVAQTETEYDFLADLEALQQPPQAQTPPTSNVIQFPSQQQTQPQETYDFLADLEAPTQQPQVVTPVQHQAVNEVPDFLADFEQPAQQQPARSPFLESFDVAIPKKEKATEKKQANLINKFSKGLQESVSGEIAKQVFSNPQAMQEVESDPGFWESLVHESGVLAGDAPYLFAGAGLGAAVGAAGGPIGATVGGAFGATAFPAFLKESLKQYREYQESGREDLSFGEFLQKADKVANRTLNEGLFGVILGATKRAIPMLKEVPGIGSLFNSKVAQTGATIAAEATVATAIPAAIAGELPTGQDYAKALALFAGFNLAHLPANAREALEQQGRKSGLSPQEFAESYSPEKLARIQKAAEKGIPKAELVGPEPEAKVTKLYHGTRESFERFDFNKSGGMAFFATEPEVAKRYAQGGGGGRQPLNTKNSFFEDEEGNLFQFDDAAKQWKPKGRFKEGSYPSEENLELLSQEERAKLEPISVDEANRLAREWMGSFTPRKSHIMVKNYEDLNILDLKTREGMEKIAALPTEGAKDPMLRKMINAARNQLKGDPGVNFNRDFWETTSYLSRDPELSKQFKEAITNPLEKMGYDGVSFQDDRHPSVALFESARKKAPLGERVKKSPTEGVPKGLLPKGIEKVLPQPPEKPTEALATAEARKAAARQGKTLDEAVSFEAPKPKAEPKTEGAFRTAVVDDLYPLQRFVESAEVENLPISEDPYKLARLYRGWSGKADTFLEFRTFDPDTLKWKGKGLRGILEPVRDDLEGFSKYLVGKRAIELRAQGKETGIDLANAQDYVKANHEKYEKSAKELKKYQSDLLNYAEKSGLISPETRQLWETMNENYVPMQRVLAEPTEEFINARTMQPKQQFYKLEGSKKPIIDPLESIIQNSYTLIRASEQNRVLRALKDFNEKYKGSKEFIEVKEIGESEPSLKNFSDFLKGEKVVDEDGVVRFFDNGKMVKMKVPSEVAEALKGIRTAEELDFIGRILNFPTRAVRAGAITLSPGTLAKLATIDQVEAFLYTDIGYVPYWDAAKGFFHAIKKDPLYYKWKAAGGDQSIATSLARSFKQQKLHKVATDKNTFDSFDSMLRAVENVSKPLEESTRLGVFEKALRRKGMSADDIRQAALEAREATLDFQRKGARTKLMAQAVPFFNASIQGAAKFFDHLKKEPLKLTAKAVAAVTVPTLANYYANKDRKEFQELPQWERDAFWHFYVDLANGDTQHYKMPRPFELGAVFATVPERLAEYAYEQDADSLKAIGENLKDTFLPSVMPAALAPFYEVATNKKLLTGAPLVTERMKNLPVEERHSPFTSETAKKISPILQKIPFVGEHASPVVIEKFLNAWTGNLGSAIVHHSEKALEKTGLKEEKIRPEQEISDLPFFKVFVGKKGYTTQARSLKKFYDESDKLQKQYNAIRQAQKEGRESTVENPNEVVSKHKYAQRVRKAFSKSWTAIRNIQLDNDPEHYTSAEKKILIDAMVKDMVEVARDFRGKER